MKKTPFYQLHTDLGARMIDFGGWEMPLLYRGIAAEHYHVRSEAGTFDVSHMGRLYLTGTGAEAFLENVCTRAIGSAKIGQCRYSQVLNDRGTVLDDVIVSRADDHFLVVCNAGNREKIIRWFRDHAGPDVHIDDRTEQTVMLAIQGPKAIRLVAKFLPLRLGYLKRYRFKIANHAGIEYTISRTGYTGEDGVELVFATQHAEAAWPLIKGDPDHPDRGIQPAGLGARDTLRIEAAMPLYGRELSEEIDPLSAGLGWCVDLDKEFIGVEALRKIHKTGPKQRLVGLHIDGKRIARQDARVKHKGRKVGAVTSGTLSPTLGTNIAMAYVRAKHASDGTRLTVDIRDNDVPATVVPLPFYKRK